MIGEKCKMKKLIAILLIGFFIMSCAPPPFKPYKPEVIKFDETPSYSVQEELDALPKPEPIKRMYVKKITDQTYEVVVDKAEATHVMMAPAEYAKVGAVVKLEIGRASCRERV